MQSSLSDDEMEGGLNDDSMTELMRACQDGEAAAVYNLLQQQSVNLLAQERTGKTALHFCAENHDTEIAEMIIGGAEQLIDMRDKEGNAALHLAVIAQNIPFIKLLLRKGANANIVDHEHHSSVHWATVCGHIEVIELLLDNNADPETEDIHSAYPIHYASQLCNSGQGVDENPLGAQVLRLLISRGVSVHSRDRSRRTPLLWAASSGGGHACRLLYDSGAEIEAEDKDGLKAIHCAASVGSKKCMEKLLTNCNAKVNALDNSGCPALFYAITHKSRPCITLLIDKGTDLTIQDSRGRSAAHVAATMGDLNTIIELDEAEAPLWLYSKRSEAPIHEAARGGHVDVVEYLARRARSKEDLNHANDKNLTCIHLGAQVGNLDVLKALVENGADRNPLVQGQSKTPYSIAEYAENEECAIYLKEEDTKEESESEVDHQENADEDVHVNNNTNDKEIMIVQEKLRHKHPVHASVARFEYIRRCNRERHRLRENLMRYAPKAEPRLVKKRFDDFFTQQPPVPWRKPEQLKDSLDWENFHKHSYTKIQLAYTPRGDPNRSRTHSSRERSRTPPRQPSRQKSADHEMPKGESKGLWGIASSVNEKKLEKYRIRHQEHEKEKERLQDGTHFPANEETEKDSLHRKNRFIKLLANAYYPVNLPKTIYESTEPQLLSRPQTTKDSLVSRITHK